MGKVITDALLAFVDGDEAAKDAAMARTMKLIDMANLVFNAETSIVGMDQKLQTAISIPALIAGMTTNIGIDEGTFEMTMDVSQNESDNTKITASNETTVEASGGGLIYSAGVKSTAKLGVTNDRKRSTDYRSTVKVYAHVAQLPPPEALSLVIDALTSNAKRGLDINEKLIDKQATQMADKMDQMDELPEPEASSE